MGKISYTVVYGDTLVSIAKGFGFLDYSSIYNDPDNASFRKKRPNPNVIFEGDILAIPDKGGKSLSVPVGSKASITLKNQKQLLRVKLTEYGEALRNTAYSFKIQGGGIPDLKIENRKSDSNGIIELSVPIAYINPSGPTIGQLVVHGLEYRLIIGSLDPISTRSGIQQRLKNDGFLIDDEPGNFGPSTKAAIRVFQEMNDLEVTGIIDDAFRSKLLRYHDNDSNLSPVEQDFTFPLENDSGDDVGEESGSTDDTIA